ncbi:hypothetical protein [Corynebacterium singulare]|uniref:Uncharacterized protein n=1 Tax=Corynebacterium singulare TaxID=161899 RepID=A0ABS9PZ60_9CORY|nr:hypothetical protein [Corynebacterium singulare]MCG7277301.1 hypothetical protein [Corynebacterium singulare]
MLDSDLPAASSCLSSTFVPVIQRALQSIVAVVALTGASVATVFAPASFAVGSATVVIKAGFEGLYLTTACALA